MCTVFLAYKVHPEFPLLIAANRDEFYARPAQPMHWWEVEQPQVLAGKDEQGGGTWLGCNADGKIAVITNYRSGTPENKEAPSRGPLVSDFLSQPTSPKEYASTLSAIGQNYNGFNLLFGDLDALYYYGNRATEHQLLTPGIYGLSNHLLDTSWPKVANGKEEFRTLVESDPNNVDAFMHFLHNPKTYPDQQLPSTGVPLRWERLLSALFVQSEDYGTRVSTYMAIDNKGKTQVAEQQATTGKRVAFNFSI